MKTNYCSTCGAKISQKARFCGECGSKIERITESPENKSKQCSNCNYTSEGDEIYCPDCGIKLIGEGKENERSKQEQPPPIKKVSEPEAKATTKPVKKKKGGCVRVFLKIVLGLFAILVVGSVILYNLGDGEDTSGSEATSDFNVDQGVGTVDSNYETKRKISISLKEPKSLKKAAANMEAIFKEADTTQLKLLLTDTSLKTYQGVYSEIQPYMDEYAKAFKSRKLIKLNKIFALYSFEDENGKEFTVEFAALSEDTWKLTRF